MNYKHNACYTNAYRTWKSMKQRCLNPNSPNYDRYGGRGITICDDWLDFGLFYRDMGERGLNQSIERIDPNGDYCPSNCVWINKSKQSGNRIMPKRYKSRNWWSVLGIEHNPYVYGPMPWKRTSAYWRKQEYLSRISP